MKSHLLLVLTALLTCLGGGLSPASAQDVSRDRLNLTVGTKNMGDVSIIVRGKPPTAQSYPARPLSAITLSYQGKSLAIPGEALNLAGPVNINSMVLRDVPNKAVAIIFTAPNRRNASSRMSTVEFIINKEKLTTIRITTPYARTIKGSLVTRETQIFDLSPQR